MTIEQLMNCMSSVLYFNEKWHARARGSEKFFESKILRYALELALADVEDEL